MDIQAELTATCPPDAIFAWVKDLSSYPEWLEIVTQAQADDDGSWSIDLRGRMGPLARTKRLRMVRTELVEPQRVVFERAELDGRQHSPWRLTADVSSEGDQSSLVMQLHYGGGLFEPLIERVLRDEIERSRLRLQGLVTADAG
ncbi:SRPBCC family protein [Aquihabitans sp. McL0605]|uniref:SRPBCC family protein n=1 Tax=Aquihabitans sp. McL0605 TaxID=3415671 RepID=UPI003CF51A18